MNQLICLKPSEALKKTAMGLVQISSLWEYQAQMATKFTRVLINSLKWVHSTYTAIQKMNNSKTTRTQTTKEPAKDKAWWQAEETKINHGWETSRNGSWKKRRMNSKRVVGCLPIGWRNLGLYQINRRIIITLEKVMMKSVTRLVTPESNFLASPS